MCLTLENENVLPKIAEEDIVCYKWLIRKAIIDLNVVKHGDSFDGIIKGIKVSGKISISSKNRISFCTNNPNLDGAGNLDIPGFKYSWLYDDDVSSIIVNGIHGLSSLITFYKNFPIQIGETYTSEIEKLSNEIEKALHSFKNLKDAKTHAENNFILHQLNAIFVKCIIPKGSTYYEGEFNSYESFASDALTYVEIVE